MAIGSRPAMATPEPIAPTAIVKHSLVVAGHRTSISLEDAFWQALRAAAAARGLSIAALVSEIDEGRGDANLSSAIRVHLLQTLAVRAGRSKPLGLEDS